ncbi:hypothetical protein [Rhizobium ruizarguesonis]|uniref:hypothetical protein n=1 Tax=Rhizobium ruizarguesonis TaxID=2081791 RepID=UPI00102FDE58|nr:hypothetical protein [Rhizobium ruizarguesonis]TAT71050.1 hypothetical protein ELI52_36400 [Rhizobium ruizarguesonis]
MKRMVGRNIFITNLKAVLKDGGQDLFVQRAADSKFAAIWIRVGRGRTADPNLSLPGLQTIRQALKSHGVELWGWHVPFCEDEDAAVTEAKSLVKWSADSHLDGVILDVERTHESPRFRGDVNDAKTYAGLVAKETRARGMGLGFSSHDQPSLHKDLPFAPFLAEIQDLCPQVYYQSASVDRRFNKSAKDYANLLGNAADFPDRFKPTGNITVNEDLPLPDAKTCVEAAGRFIRLVKEKQLAAYSFWCWDGAPTEIWEFFKDTSA